MEAASAAYAAGKAPQSEKLLRDATQEFPNEPSIYVSLARFYYAQRRYRDADEALHAALKLRASARLYMDLGTLYAEGLNRPVEAVDYFYKAVGQDPNLPGAHYALGQLLSKMDQPEQARKEFTEAARLDPKNALSWLGLARIEVRAKLSGAEALIEHLQLMIAKMKRELFGPRSERSQRLIDQLELQLEELAAAALAKVKTRTGRLWTYVRDDRPFWRRRPAGRGVLLLARSRRRASRAASRRIFRDSLGRRLCVATSRADLISPKCHTRAASDRRGYKRDSESTGSNRRNSGRRRGITVGHRIKYTGEDDAAFNRR